MHNCSDSRGFQHFTAATANTNYGDTETDETQTQDINSDKNTKIPVKRLVTHIWLIRIQYGNVAVCNSDVHMKSVRNTKIWRMASIQNKDSKPAQHHPK